MKFRTEVNPKVLSYKISHHHQLMHIGSCFSEHIGNQFKNLGMRSLVNPMGQVYNPLSICNSLDKIISQYRYTERDLVFHNDLYHTWDHHSDFSHQHVSEILNDINEQLEMAYHLLKTADFLFITPATAHYFQLKETGQVVSNCHKHPSQKFELQMATSHEIYDRFHSSLNQVYQFNPAIQIIFTVSPIRYYAFGSEENTISKSMIFSAYYKLKQEFKSLYYFPSYEIIMDDLRDYRFYESDLLHPTQLAISYVWDKIKAHLCDDACSVVFDQVASIKNAANHRPRNNHSLAHQTFIQKTITQIEELERTYTYIDLSDTKRKLLDGI